MNMDPISFPGLHLSFNIQPVAFQLFGFPVYWYGIIIATGLVLAMLYGMKRAGSFGILQDDLMDVIIFSLIAGIVGARLYYVIFYKDPYGGANPYFTDPLSIIQFRNGGLGIYGGIIAAFLCALIVCRVKKISTGAVFDIAGLGFLIGQGIGRWGNFVNREAYGAQTGLPWRMVVDTTQTGYHPCFFYEFLWCAVGFILLHIYSKRRKFNGEVFLMYMMWYAVGRFFIEGLRTDSLMLGNIKISQLVAVVAFAAAGVYLLIRRSRLKANGSEAEYTPIYEDASKALQESEEQNGEENGDGAEPAAEPDSTAPAGTDNDSGAPEDPAEKKESE